MSRFVFLDRDGTLIEDRGFAYKLEDYRLLPGVVEGLARLAGAGFAFAITTNQSGIGRGYYGVLDYEAFQQHLLDDLARQGIAIAGSFFCPHRPDDDCACRKPRTGLIEQACRELAADVRLCWTIGDRVRDVEMGRRAGCAGGVLLGSKETAREAAGFPRARDLVEAAEIVLRA